ncbi:glycosyltransferase (plasmid) [Paucilactobacillus suebicus]|uniref:Glycosyltransferase n=1 Tax=Paucilactobacillus suebicus DSM 5007 = KCTC 3549 TaxID=1423807 RepID=A0A0R1W552_9LACO|nr:glycosyltransferase [Paucilactobacillus suebicus]KRM10486.1 glycosyltransferase [Paucilactobacillus suebicus DSM 5007 = KCTC 3549]
MTPIIFEYRYTALLAINENEISDHLRLALCSILDQTLLPSQIVIVKDGRKESQIYRVLAHFATDCASRLVSLKIVYNQEHSGMAYALNRGLKHCDYSLVARFDSDDISIPERMAKTLQMFNERPQLSVIGSWIGEFETAVEDVVDVRKVPASHALIKKISHHRNPLNQMTVTFRKNAVMSNGGYASMESFEDYYLWLAMLSEHMQFANIQKPLVLARHRHSRWQQLGKKVFKQELEFQHMVYREHYIRLSEYVMNVA